VLLEVVMLWLVLALALLLLLVVLPAELAAGSNFHDNDGQ
jgi:hypothetical protein